MMSEFNKCNRRKVCLIISLAICLITCAGILPGKVHAQYVEAKESSGSVDIATSLTINATPSTTPTPTETPALPGGYVLYFDGGDYYPER